MSNQQPSLNGPTHRDTMDGKVDSLAQTMKGDSNEIEMQ